MSKHFRQRDPLWVIARPMMRATVLLGTLFVVGTVGFKHFGAPSTTWIDSLYMTTITLTTVGYGEIVDLSHSPAGRVFTIALLLVGVGSFLYFFSNVTAFVVEGTLDRLFWRHRMARQINSLEDHFIVCGGGTTGENVVGEFIDTGRSFILIDKSQERVLELYARFKREFTTIIGDATEDSVLREAGIEQALGIVSCLGSDKDNLVVTFSARHLNQKMRIVTSCKDLRDEGKLKLAGADAVVLPDRIGGLRLASEMVRPKVVSFLDTMLREKELGIRVEELVIDDESSLKDFTVGDLLQKGVHGLLIMALRHEKSGVWTYNPGPNETLSAGTTIVYMGTRDTAEAMRNL